MLGDSGTIGAHFDRKLGRTRVPVVSIQMPRAPLERDLYEEMLVAMGGVFAYGTSVTTLRHRIRALARQLEVRLLIKSMKSTRCSPELSASSELFSMRFAFSLMT